MNLKLNQENLIGNTRVGSQIFIVTMNGVSKLVCSKNAYTLNNDVSKNFEQFELKDKPNPNRMKFDSHFVGYIE